MSGLCHRCEHRVRFIEDGKPRPRYECGDLESSKHACYMYKPVTPCLIKKDMKDPRPQFGPAMIASRSSFAGLPEADYRVKLFEEGVSCLYVEPDWKKGDEDGN